MAATPPMRSTVPTPSSPLHGGRYDTYHAPRKSARQTATRSTRAIQTPPLPAEDLPHKPVSFIKKKPIANQPREHLESPPSSTHTSPRKKAKRNTGTQDTTAVKGNEPSRAASEDPFYNPTHDPNLQQPSHNPGINMLPTPVKTPRKKPAGQAGLRAGGRVLFPDRSEDPMPTPRKNRKGKRHVGFSLYSSMEDDIAGADNDISIYTDSKDKVPELDQSEDNPFFERPGEAGPQPDPSKGRVSLKRKAAYGLDGKKDIEEAFKREEGMVYVFRGKKVYRKFPSEEPDADEDKEVIGEDAGSSKPHSGSLTRSSIKPRLLFPTAAQKAHRTKSDLEDEEAPTDIDDPDATETEHELPPMERTPVKATFSGLVPDTPPDTGHATRSATKKAAKDGLSAPAISPVKLDFNKPLRGKRVSPFDGWARTKPGTTVGKGTKRSADAVEEMDNDELLEEMSSKRVKANTAS